MSDAADVPILCKIAKPCKPAPSSDFFLSSRPSVQGRFMLGGSRYHGMRNRHFMSRPCGRAFGPHVVSVPSQFARGPYLVSVPTSAGHASSDSFLLNRSPEASSHASGVSSRRDSKAICDEDAGVYVLEKPGGEFYVGKSRNIGERIKQHAGGLGASCARGGLRRVAPVTPEMNGDLEAWERAETLARMFRHGISKVRGWMYTSPVLTDAEREHAFQQVCERHDLCRRCGLGGHFAAKCKAGGGGGARLSAANRPVWAR